MRTYPLQTSTFVSLIISHWQFSLIGLQPAGRCKSTRRSCCRRRAAGMRRQWLPPSVSCVSGSQMWSPPSSRNSNRYVHTSTCMLCTSHIQYICFCVSLHSFMLQQRLGTPCSASGQTALAGAISSLAVTSWLLATFVSCASAGAHVLSPKSDVLLCRSWMARRVWTAKPSVLTSACWSPSTWLSSPSMVRLCSSVPDICGLPNATPCIVLLAVPE